MMATIVNAPHTTTEDRMTVRTLLNELAAAGIIRAEGKTRARRYYPVSADHAAEGEGGP